MKPDWEGIVLCLGIVAGVYMIGGTRWSGISLVLVALILARAKQNRRN